MVGPYIQCPFQVSICIPQYVPRRSRVLWLGIGKGGIFQTVNMAVFSKSLNRDISVVHGPRVVI